MAIKLHSVHLEPYKQLEEKIVYFLLNPIVSFLYSLWDVRSRSSYIIFFLTGILFGWMFCADVPAMDSFRYKLDFLDFANSPTSRLMSSFSDYFSGESRSHDVIINVFYWVAAVVGGKNYHFYFLFVAIVFCYFSLKSMSFVTGNRNFVQDRFMILLLLVFVMSNCIFNINGARFYLAAWMGVCAIFEVVITHRYRYLILVLILPLVHGSMLIVWPVLLISIMLKNQFKILLPILILSFFVSEIILQGTDLIGPLLPKNLQLFLYGYTQSQSAIARMENANPLAGNPILVTLGIMRELFLLAMAILLVCEYKKFTTKNGKAELGFYLAFLSCCNFLNIIPSGGRFLCMTIPFLVYLWVDNYDIMKKYRNILYLIPIVYSSYIYEMILYITSVIGIDFYIAPLPYQIIHFLI